MTSKQKILEQKDIDAWETDENGIKTFPENSEFGDGCKFGGLCDFGDDCQFGDNCKFGTWCKFGNGCKFGDDCQFVIGCEFGSDCKFGRRWSVITEIIQGYDLSIGHFGNGETIYNLAREVRGDYEKIAHVAEDGTLTYYKKHLPDAVKAFLVRHAASFAAQDPKWYRR